MMKAADWPNSGPRLAGARSRLRAFRSGIASKPIGGGLLALALLSGCAARGEIDRFSTVRDVAPREAFVLPAAGGPSIVGVLEQRYSNGVEQEIVLSGGGGAAGQNRMRVQFIGPVDASTSGRTALSERSLARADIAGELRQEFPGVAMRRSALYVQNRYGPFGYATGQVGGTTCLYAWQRLSGTDHATLILRPRGIINLRLRQCEAGASEAQLLATLYGLGVNAFLNHFSWMPYGDPPSPSPTLGQGGAPVYPEPLLPASAGTAPAAPVSEPAPPPRAHRAAPRAAVRSVPRLQPAPPAALEPLPQPVGPPVPPPPGVTSLDAAGVSAALVPAPPGTASPAATPARPVVAPPAICADGRLMGASGC
ncbi:cellulose biosynthesis protein BcsN [Aureimonas sp. N4]|uniref:cellulose biosynthesis protein BcsN n=1 Tax=Aureimonas sp. N4 TaxID=1638165 RepID=UPI00178C832D|nr:cellulose biosynthesis protein BcsN [Aureimonas sp. N4]